MRADSRARMLFVGGLLLLGGCVRVAAPSSRTMTTGDEPAAPAARAPEVAAATTPPADEAGFPFPKDAGGTLLEKRLSPPASLPGGDGPLGPVRRPPAVTSLEPPAAPLPPNSGPLPRLSRQTAPPSLRLRPLSEEMPLAHQRGEPQRPQEVRLPAGERLRTPGPDPDRPAPLPPTAQPVPEPAQAADPAAEFSTSAAHAAVPPARTTPVPFTRFTLPDPDEHRGPMRLRQAPLDDGPPMTGKR